MPRPSIFFAWLGCLIATAALAAESRSPIRVEIRTAATEIGFVLRLQAELEALGFSAPIVSDQATALSSEASVSVAEETPAAAVVQVDAQLMMLTVLYANNQQTSWEVGQELDSSVLLAIVEQLRARLIGDVPGPPAPAPQPVAVAEPSAPATASWQLGAASLISFSPGGLSSALEGELRAGWRPRQLFSLELAVRLPLVASELTRQEGVVQLRPFCLAAQLRVHRRPWRWLELAGGAQVGMLFLYSWGEASMSGEQRREWSVTSLVAGTAALSLQLSSSWQLQLLGLAGLAVPELVLRFGEREVARWGQPLLAAGLSAQLSL